jgi:predicted phage terminase large subunit-like protein
MTNLQLSPEEAAQELLIRRRARSDILDYVNAIEIPGKPANENDPDEEFFLPVETTVAQHHRLLLQKLDEISKRPHGRMMIFMPPGSAKSTYASVVFPSKFLGEKPGRKVILASYGDDLARKMGRRTRQIVKSKRFRAIWECELSTESSAADEWSLSNGSEYMACGILSGITGNRAHGIIIDDPIKGREQAESETIRQKTWDAYEDDLKTRLIPGGWIVLIQTRWHEDDLAGRILPDSWDGQSGPIECKDGNVWEVVCLQACCEVDNDPLGRLPGEYLWPEWFDRQHWAQFESNPRTWFALYQQKPRPSEGGEFKKHWVMHYKDARAGAGMNKIILVDPSSGRRKSKNNDFTSMWVIGLAHDGNAYALDIVRDKLNLTERARTLMALHRKWKPYEVRYEQYGMQADIEHIQSVMEHEQYRFKIIEIGGGVNKEDRVRRLIPKFQNGEIWLPETFWYTRTDGKQYDLVHEFIHEEYLAFPVGRHDDMMDALARMCEPGKDFELKWPSQQKVMPNLPGFSSSTRGMGALG